ncbi:hypothetical protein SEA_WEASELS2_239 [Rhodococcus phage Weasels2]|uniref:Uncharacterized protein n=1 Tax=Rhodococcus phage Weasels2 TaxID=1897437 RepID=A0A1I9SAL1_9CAUD|nr:hypothetical protein FDH04_gp177 [Rhodococcus phage Weasels2]AOZ63817.1 hypothetical protein SEA_WEASELS2_239 [Rhodococcus phage Weasels2]
MSNGDELDLIGDDTKEDVKMWIRNRKTINVELEDKDLVINVAHIAWATIEKAEEE